MTTTVRMQRLTTRQHIINARSEDVNGITGRVPYLLIHAQKTAATIPEHFALSGRFNCTQVVDKFYYIHLLVAP